MLNVTLKSLWGHKRRLLGTILAIFLGVAFLTGTLALSDTLRANFNSLFNDVYKGTDAVVRSSNSIKPGGRGGGQFRQRGLIDTSLLPRVRSVPGVARAQPYVSGFGQVLDKTGKRIGGKGPPTFAANWIEDPNLNPYIIRAGRPPAASGEVVIDRGVAKKAHFIVGDTTMVETPDPVPVRIVGVASFGSRDSSLGATYAGFTLADAERYITKHPGQVGSIVVGATPGISQGELVQRLQRVLPSRVEAVTGATATKESIDQINSAFLDLIRTFLLIFATIALLVASFSIYNTFSIIVAQRSRESALLRAVGASRRQVLAAVVGESVAVGLVASVLGLFGGVAVATALKGAFAVFGGSLPAGGLVFKAGTADAGLVVGFVVTVLAGIIPAVQASRVAPLAAMRDVALDRTDTSRRRAVVGAVLIGLGVVIVLSAVVGGATNVLPRAGLGALLTIVGFVVFGPVAARPASGALGTPLARLRGITGSLARENAMRNPRRTSGTAAALMVGVGVVTLFTVFAASLKASVSHSVSRSFGGDVVVRVPGFGDGGLAPQLADAIGRVPGVERAVGAGGGIALVGGTGEQLIIADPARLEGVLDVGVVGGDFTRLGPQDLAVSKASADARHFKVGQSVPVFFTDGSQAQFRVGAIYDHADVVGNYFMSRSAWQPHAVQDLDFLDLVKLKAGADVKTAKVAVQQLVKPYGAPDVQDRQEYINSVAGNVNRLLNFVYVLLFLAIVIALMGIANTLSLSVYERTRELGLLRAVGETRGQVRSMVRWESVIVSVFGTVGGLLIGVFLGWALVQAASHGQEVNRFAAPFIQLVAVLLVGALAGVLAGWRPARRAARLDVLQAIATE